MINVSIKKPKPVLVMVHNASKGLRGVGLSGVTLDKDGNLIFTMSDGTVQTIKGYSQDLVNTTNEINNIKEEVSTIANNAADSAKEAKETADSIKQEYDRVEGATNSGLALIERSVLYGINRVKEATKACKSDALANIELAHKDAIDDIAIRRLEALQDIAGANAAAVSSAAAAKTSETNAETSNQMAKKWAESTESPDGATDSDSSTGNTQSSKSWALHSKSNASAAKVSETNAKTSETNASKSATAAKVSETNAKGSETASAISEANAKTSESNAASSASAAADSASAAKTSETNAASSKTAAANSAKAAAGSATAAASSASSASTSATNAKAAMNTANTAASSASTSATSASTSASNASKSEIAAKTAQIAAEKARDDANTAVNKLTGAMKYAGQVDNYSDLESYAKNKGDIWNIVNADPAHGIKAGDNVAWNGTDWDNLSGTVDLSIYAEKADYQKVITSATANGATITFNYKDGTTSTATVNNVASATAATNDAKGQRIDSTYEKVADASNVHTSLQNSINSLSTSKQDKLTFDLTPTADSSNPVTSSGIKTALDGKPSNTGAGASGTWPISVSGNASTATKATNDGNGNPIASTYLPLSGGTLTGVVNGVTPTAGDNSKKLATTEFVANTYATKRDVANTYLDKLSKTEQVVTAPIKGTLNGNASSATKLETARTINVTDADGTNTGTGASFDGSGNATIKLPAKIKATLTGNADTATKLETARTINIQDATSAHTGTGASFNGTANATIKLPNTIDANITGAIIDQSGLSGYTKLYNSLSPKCVRAVVSCYQDRDNMSAHIWGACISFKYSEFQSGENHSDNGGQLILGNGIQGLWYRTRNTQRASDTDPEWYDLQQIAYTTSNVASATKLANARTINVQDASASNTGTGASFDGSGNATIKLPAKIKATLTGNADTATKATNDGNGNNIASTYLPAVVGAVVAFAGKTAPQGWLLCDGSAVSRTNYAALYAAIGTTYGAGDGSTTFNLPNLVNRMAVGSGSSYAIAATGGEASHKLTVDELPPQSPYGIQSVYQDGGLKTASAVDNGPYRGRIVVCSGEAGKGVVYYGGNQPHNNMPPYLALRYIIKY